MRILRFAATPTAVVTPLCSLRRRGEAMRAYPALLEPLLFYVLHRVGARINDPTADAGLKLCVMDEAWRFIQHEKLRGYVQEALKTWRKRNAAMLLATQTIDDFASTDLLRTVGTTENNREARFYALTAAGRRQLASEKQAWDGIQASSIYGVTPGGVKAGII